MSEDLVIAAPTPHDQKRKGFPVMITTFTRTAVAALLTMMITGLFTGSANAADDQDRTVSFKNQSGSAITEIYTTNIRSNNWSDNILTRVLKPNSTSLDITIDDEWGYCRFNIKAFSRDGRVFEGNDINVCEKYEITIN